MAPAGYAIGIDLGTTDTCVAAYHDGRIEIIPADGCRTMPSYVAFTDTGQRLVGAAAKSQVHVNPENTLFDALRLIGRSFADVEIQADMKHFPFRVVDKAGRPAVSVVYKGEIKTLTPEEVLSMIVTKAKENAEAYLGATVDKAVITVPPYFNTAQRQSIRDIALISGLEPLYLLGGPTAAAFTYAYDHWSDREQTLLFVDVGGGTSDVTLLTIEEGILEVKATASDMHLGGEDFDNRLVRFCVKELELTDRIDGTDRWILKNARTLRRLRTACERAKRELSSQKQTQIQVDSLHKHIDFHTTVTRLRFEELCMDLFRSVLQPVERVLRDAKMDESSVREIVMIGGSSRIPMIQNLLSDFFGGKEVSRSLNLDEAAAYGAAILAGIYSGYGGERSSKLNEFLLLDVAPLSLGIEDRGGLMRQLIKRNTIIPTKKSEVFTSSEDYQAFFDISLFEGERARVKDNNLLARFSLQLHLAPRAQVEITLDCDVHGICRLSAIETITGRRATVWQGARKRLSAEEIDRIQAEARKYKTDEQAEAYRISERNALESSAYSMKRNIFSSSLESSTALRLTGLVDMILNWLYENQSLKAIEYRLRQAELEKISARMMTELSDREITTLDSGEAPPGRGKDQNQQSKLSSDLNSPEDLKSAEVTENADSAQRSSSHAFSLPAELVSTSSSQFLHRPFERHVYESSNPQTKSGDAAFSPTLENHAEGLSARSDPDQASKKQEPSSRRNSTLLNQEHRLAPTDMDRISLVSSASQDDARNNSPGLQTKLDAQIISVEPFPASSLWLHLGPKEFRLLHRSGDKVGLELKLKTHKIEYPPRYRALSHVWGTQPKEKSLLCGNWDGTFRASLQVTKTLYDALDELAVEEIPIWVDTICINQANLEEKSKQVALMHRIYRRADQVAIWLDRRRDTNSLALDVLSWIAMPPAMTTEEERLDLLPTLKRRLEQPGNTLQVEQLQNLASVASNAQRVPISRADFQRMGIPRFHDSLWEALGAVLSPPWLFRLWTFQELMLGKHCFVAFGNTHLPWRTYYDVGMQLSLCGLLDHCISHLPPDRKARALTAFTRLSPFLSSSEKVVPFWRYLDEARYRDVMEPVDRVYGVLSLANDSMRSKVTVSYSADWKANYWRVFLEVSKAVMKASSAQAVLGRANSKTKARELPSWCPDFTVPCEVTSFGANARAGMQYGKSIQPHYDRRVISIGGAKVDQVAHVVPFSWSWPQLDILDIYGPTGLAAQTLDWLNTCWSYTREAHAQNEAGAHRAYVLTILGEVPDTQTDTVDSVWFDEKDDTLIDLRSRLENLKICAGPEDTEDSAEVWHRYQTIFRKLDDIWRNRVFFTTTGGKVGFASDRTSLNDHVCLFFGESHMYLLRDRPGGFHAFVSDAYVDGYMVGTASENPIGTTVFKLY